LLLFLFFEFFEYFSISSFDKSFESIQTAAPPVGLKPIKNNKKHISYSSNTFIHFTN
jgi:hypothetical protein